MAAIAACTATRGWNDSWGVNVMLPQRGSVQVGFDFGIQGLGY